MRKAFDPREYLGPEAISPNALELNELFPPAVLARFLLLHITPFTAKIVTAEDGESWAEPTGEPFSSLLDDVWTVST